MFELLLASVANILVARAAARAVGAPEWAAAAVVATSMVIVGAPKSTPAPMVARAVTLPGRVATSIYTDARLQARSSGTIIIDVESEAAP